MTKGHDTDEWLMLAVADGKRDCLTPLVQRYATPLLTFIQRMIGDRHQSEEVFQEVFLSVWTKRRTYRYPKPFKPWLFSIAANRCYADFRRYRVFGVPLDEIPNGTPSAGGAAPLDTVVATETAVLIAKALAELPHQQRTVVVLRVWNGMSYAEISHVVQCTESTVRSHMHHGLTALRKFLEPRLLNNRGGG